MTMLRRMIHRWDNDGPWSLLLGVYRTLRGKLRRQPAPEARPGGGEGFVHPFDAAMGVDTSGFIPGEVLENGSPSDFYTTAYYGISPSSLEEAIRHVPGDPEVMTFVDLGCGKGRALLVAAKFGFREIVGVELSPELCRVAEKNTAGEPRVRVLEADATEVKYPDGPLLLFLYHPFLAPVLIRVMKNLGKQISQDRREVYVLYANPSYPKVMARFQFLTEVWNYMLPLSAEDAAADRHGLTHERFTLYKSAG